MHFHIPKPLHGWREFAGEVGIIVVGVLIALGFEQMAESWSWHERSAKGMEAIRGEMAINYNFATEMAVTAPCIDRQLAVLEDKVASSGGLLTAASNYSEAIYARYTYRAPSREWPDQVWQALVSEGVTSHLRPNFRSHVAVAYDHVRQNRATNRMNDQLAYRLQLLARPVPLDPASRNHLIEEIEEARGNFDDMRLLSNQIAAEIGKAGLAPARASTESFLRASGTVIFCKTHGMSLGKLEPQL